MTRRAVLALLAAALLAGAPGSAVAAGEESALQPLQLVRSLQLVQDRVADGDHAALPMQRKLLEMIDKRIRAASDEELSTPASFRAVLVYAMSGGNPATLESFINRVRLDEADSRKAIGVLSYLNGGSKSAALALSKVNPLDEPPELGAFLALVRGSVAAEDDPGTALRYLDQARLLSPGTLVEEAALRRSVPLAVAAHQDDRFLLACDQYVRTYLRSPYASQFADSLVSGVVAMHETIDLARVEAIVDLMTPEQQQVIYLRIARRSAIDGLTALSQFASERVLMTKTPAVPDDDPRALLYSTLANVATQPIEQLQANLQKIDRARLSAGDLKLLDAVMEVSDQLTSAVAPAEGAQAASRPSEAGEPLVIESPPPPIAQAPAADEPPAATQPAPEADAAGAAQTPAPEPAKAQPAPAQAAKAPAPAPSADPAAAQPAAAEPLPPIPETQPEATTPPAEGAADTAAAPPAEAPALQDPADIMVAEGRKKLDEIDQLLAKAAK